MFIVLAWGRWRCGAERELGIPNIRNLSVSVAYELSHSRSSHGFLNTRDRLRPAYLRAHRDCENHTGTAPASAPQLNMHRHSCECQHFWGMLPIVHRTTCHRASPSHARSHRDGLSGPSACSRCRASSSGCQRQARWHSPCAADCALRKGGGGGGAPPELTGQRLRPTVPRPGWSGARRNSMMPHSPAGMPG